MQIKVKDFLTRETWTQGANARNRKGRSVMATDYDAESFCLMGAFVVCYDDLDDRRKARNKLRDIIGMSIPTFNDTKVYPTIRNALVAADV